MKMTKKFSEYLAGAFTTVEAVTTVVKASAKYSQNFFIIISQLYKSISNA
jgi:hypothetical protein